MQNLFFWLVRNWQRLGAAVFLITLFFFLFGPPFFVKKFSGHRTDAKTKTKKREYGNRCYAFPAGQALVSNTKLGTNPTKWLQSFDDVWHLVLPREAVKRVLALGEKESWELVWDDIIEITDSGALGKKLFGFALRAIAETKISDTIANAAEEIWSMDVINHATLIKLTRDTEAKLNDVADENCLDGVRMVKITYRGFDIELEVKDIPHHILAFHAVVRGYAAECGELEMLMAESQLVDKSGKARKGVVDAKLLIDAKNSRGYANKVLAARGAKDGKTMMEPGDECVSLCKNQLPKVCEWLSLKMPKRTVIVGEGGSGCGIA